MSCGSNLSSAPQSVLLWSIAVTLLRRALITPPSPPSDFYLHFVFLVSPQMRIASCTPCGPMFLAWMWWTDHRHHACMRAAVHFQCQIEHFSNATPCNFLNQNITSASANSIFRSNQLSKVEQNDSVETCCSSEKHGLLFHTSVSAIYPKRLLRSGAILLSKRRLKQIRPSLTHPPSAQ